MGDRATLARARLELEELYLGIPDESTDISFKDFASFQQNGVAERNQSKMEPVKEDADDHERATAKSSSFDFSKALGEASQKPSPSAEESNTPRGSIKRNKNKVLNVVAEENHSRAYNDMSNFSMAAPLEGAARRRRPGIPHSNICTLCSEYIYIFRRRCLVCGRVYCRPCVGMGMGEMTEGRKCVDCLGRRFSQRYIHKAGKIGCCWRCPSYVKQQELIWAEKGARGTGEKRCRKSFMVSRSYCVSRTRAPVVAEEHKHSSFASNSHKPFHF